jgi:hypothetical protein
MINDYADVIGQLSVISYQWAKGGELRAKGENETAGAKRRELRAKRRDDAVFPFALRSSLYVNFSEKETIIRESVSRSLRIAVTSVFMSCRL